MKDFVINSDLIDEWNWEKNNELGLYPDALTLGSGKKVWWTCECGHDYQMPIYARQAGHNNCSYCLGKKILVGFNDLQTVSPMLASEWNHNRNVGLDPTMVTGVCGKSVWWTCQYGHEWEAKISNRYNGNGCPYCSGYYILPGLNDLATTRPDLAEEWNYEKNDGLLPTQISRGYGRKVWWKCKEKSHEWQASPNSRDNMGSGCPACSKGNRISLQETIIYFYIKKYFNDTKHGYRDKKSGITEIDVFIPHLMVGIEYDGHYWHQDVEKDKKKDMICKSNDITLIRIRDIGCPVYESNCEFITLHNRSINELCNVCEQILNKLGVVNPLIDIGQDFEDIKQLRDKLLCQNNTK